MNREQRRRLKQNDLLRHPVMKQTTIQSAINHQKMREVMDEGIMLGFHSARSMIYQTALMVKGIGDKRAKELSELFDKRLMELAKIKDDAE